MPKYINDVDTDYKKCAKLEKILFFGYIVSLIASVILCIKYNEFLCYLLILVHILYVTFETFNDTILKNAAERERRKTFLSNSYNCNLTEKKTKGYYNNKEKEPQKKMGLNSFESIYFTKNILNKMIFWETLKFVIEIIIWITIILVVKDENLILCITQCIFSTELLVNYFKLIYYYAEVKRLYNNFYSLFVTSKYDYCDSALLLEYVIDYECLKNFAHIMLSDTIFEKNNKKWSSDWKNILKEVK